jgi:hypothetical protein
MLSHFFDSARQPPDMLFESAPLLNVRWTIDKGSHSRNLL